MERIRTAVIGAGHLGRHHAQKYAALPQCDLRLVVDTNAESAANVARTHGAQPLGDYRGVFGEVDAVSVAVPASEHFPIVRDCLEAGLDVLVEKPIALTAEDATRLTDLAARRGRILQVGHLERFNPVTVRLRQLLRAPLFIECHRLSPFSRRGNDVDVVRDLMIHDLDLLLCLTGADIERVEAIGTGVLTDSTDIVNARVYLSSGCVANLTSSRISMKSERKMRFFQRDLYISADFRERKLTVARRTQHGAEPGVEAEQLVLEGDALHDEIAAFVHCVQTREPPPVGGEDGRRALDAAQAVLMAIAGGAGHA